MPRLLLTFAIFLISASPLFAQSTERQDSVLEGCNLAFLAENDIEIAAEKQGVLRQMAVGEGSIVEEGAVIARLDNEEAKMQLHVAEQQRKAALARYNDKVEEEYARAAAAASEANYADLQAANSGGIRSVVTPTELRAAELEWVRAKLQIEKALKDRELASYDYWVRKAEVEAAQMEIDRRVIKAPFAGEVMELFKKQGEWVNPGEPILQLVKYDTLECSGKVDIGEYDPREIEGCDVTVEAVVGRGRVVNAKGRVIRVEQQVQWEGRYVYRVQAEIPNRMEGGRWLLLPGLDTTMTIHLGTAKASLGRAE